MEEPNSKLKRHRKVINHSRSKFDTEVDAKPMHTSQDTPIYLKILLFP